MCVCVCARARAVNDLIIARGPVFSWGGGGNVTYCTSEVASKNFKNYYIVIHLFVI